MEDSYAQLGHLKRKRSSPSISSPAPPPLKAAKTTHNAVQINYLARQSPQDLPLINKNENISSILDVLSAYTAVLDRHESLASNLGARPLGPILIKRFERCFDAPPDIIASHSHSKDGSDAPHVTWLEVIQFAQSHPSQFTLSTFSEGRRVCQFYYPQKQVRVQVSEEDYLFIRSGRCQDLIPPLPIWEDEEKEVGTCEILEKQLRELTNAADTVAARTRQLAHRLRGRRTAIMERRAGEKNGTAADQQEAAHEHHPPEHNTHTSHAYGHPNVNANGQLSGNGGAMGNGEPTTDGSVRSDLLRHFQSLSQNQTMADASRRASSVAVPASASPTKAAYHREASPAAPPPSSSRANDRPDPLSYYLSESAPPPPVNIPTSARPSNAGPQSPTNSHHGGAAGQSASKHNFSRPLAPLAEMAQPFRSLCQAHMESLGRGARVRPPCDRCRRLKMDCLKNLTSCQGCTKKHARCHWRDVERSEVEGLEGFGAEGAGHDSGAESGAHRSRGNTSATTYGSGNSADESEDEGMGALEDLEALERQSDEGVTGAGPSASAPHPPHSPLGAKADVDSNVPPHAKSADKSHSAPQPATAPSSARPQPSEAGPNQIRDAASNESTGGARNDIFRGSLPYPNQSAGTTQSTSTTRPASTTVPISGTTGTAGPSAAMLPPPRDRQGSYGFPHPPSREGQNQTNGNPAPPLDTNKTSKPTNNHVHVATPHPSYRPSAFTSVNANAFNGVNGDSSISDKTVPAFKNPFPAPISLHSPPHSKRDHDEHNKPALPAQDPKSSINSATTTPARTAGSNLTEGPQVVKEQQQQQQRPLSPSSRILSASSNGTVPVELRDRTGETSSRPPSHVGGNVGGGGGGGGAGNGGAATGEATVAAPSVINHQSVTVGAGGSTQGWRGA